MVHQTIQAIIESVEKPAIYITNDYSIEAVNQAYRDTYKTEVLLGKSKCYEVSHNATKPCDQQGETCPLSSCKITDKNSSALHIHRTELGDVYCSILMKPVKNNDGITIGFLEILEKIDFASSVSSDRKLIGKSQPFQNLLKMITRSASSNISVLLQGDTGTGKELVALSIHQASKRKNEAFIEVECTGLSESLFESELFGHEKGAFTGANTSKKGLVCLANNGTLFLDEIGDVPLNLQVKLLRLIETGYYRRVGGIDKKKANFRLICASHKNIEKMVVEGTFREDLYYRIAGFPIRLPTLKERQSDISLLAEHLLSKSEFSSKMFSPEALTKLSNYHYPGNIRELKNIVQRSALLSDDEFINIEHLPQHITNATKVEDHPANLLSNEKKYLIELLNKYGNQPKIIADNLEVSVRTLYRKLQKHQLNIREYTLPK
ncbi:sigma 54-interacting transcriptional regulator [Colwellia sp. 4_MG-2023]|uniref:sigma-54 interaction domain-containing protein n=1 Tax=unclassified Colwellia TaxID=196834 RepID=UPI001C0A2709|nr:MULTISPECIES: sigma-54-dependent Fis family transcriptional regulator [unclassified Colwellia]MBU2925470.1 sigma-54-dependent Fis family transcriptional regulator [Colwellia sp. C2M11]MDO6506428.1 sigma 54-interacting transcriptional regulator [Colwellia sp. 5_MG-2023]MDO6555252.1 sigma 54-interacting transcriptional regulator [Colwellia sp. 4_MG-2023]MDO6651562.1 sigma 54-interacting transcriptional regulator [Colwellia sp. 3_MG-2023]MDO6665040.1 sigma 54-interacting transcriptional regula